MYLCICFLLILTLLPIRCCQKQSHVNNIIHGQWCSPFLCFQRRRGGSGGPVFPGLAAAWTSTGAWNNLNTLGMLLTTVLVFPILLMLLLQHLRPWKPPMKIHVHSKQCIIQHTQAIYHSCCSVSTHRMAPPHRYASFLSIPNHDHHLTKINRCNTVTVHLQNDAPATICDPSLYYKKKQGKIMTLPGAPTKT